MHSSIKKKNTLTDLITFQTVAVTLQMTCAYVQQTATDLLT